MRKTSTFRAHIPAGVEHENFKIDCRTADIVLVERNVRLRNVCIRLTYIV